MIVAVISTCTATAMAVYIGVTASHPAPARQRPPRVNPVERQAVVVPSPAMTMATSGELSSAPTLPSPALNLSRAGDSDYRYDLTLSQLQAALPDVSCSASDGEPGRTTCLLERPEQVSKVCAFRGCQQEMIIFDDHSGQINSVSASLSGEAWLDMKQAMNRDAGVTPLTSEVELPPLVEHYTCFSLTNGSLRFAYASGTDVYGRPIARPYTAFFELGRGCDHLPGRATSD